jgi:hypothetical protein
MMNMKLLAASFACLLMASAPAPSTALAAFDDIFGGINDAMDEMNTNMEEAFDGIDLTLGQANADIDSAIQDIFGLFDFTDIFKIFDLDQLFESIEGLVSGASAEIQGFANVFENSFAKDLPEQYAIFMKDTQVDMEQLVEDVFNGLEDIPASVELAIENAGDAGDDILAALLDVPKFAAGLAAQGVDTVLLQSTAEITDLFEHATGAFASLLPSTADVAKLQKTVATLTEEQQTVFKNAMAAARDTETGAVDEARAWTAILAEPALKSELLAQGVNPQAVAEAVISEDSSSSAVAATFVAVGAGILAAAVCF